MDELEGILGYHFTDPQHLRQALTHASLRYEGVQTHLPDNQRLEFLGDAVLQLVLSDTLYQSMPTTDEGGLTKVRATIVSSKALAQVARKFGFGKFIIMGRGQEASGGRERDSVLADVVEALFGATYLDGGIEAARGVILRLLRESIEAQRHATLDHQNPKGLLQELIQNISSILPAYEIVKEHGPDHNKHFLATVSWNGQLLGEGAGRSKKEAEIAAASAAMQNPRLKVIILSNAS